MASPEDVNDCLSMQKTHMCTAAYSKAYPDHPPQQLHPQSRSVQYSNLLFQKSFTTCVNSFFSVCMIAFVMMVSPQSVIRSMQ